MYVDLMGLEKKAQAEQFRVEFINAYDEYLSLESIYIKKQEELMSAIRNPFYYGTYEYLKMDRTEAKNKLDIQEKITRELHYSRNDYNIINGAISIGWYEPEYLGSTYLGAYFHQDFSELGAERKFISPDGHKEIIYYKDGTVVDNIKYIGTYNIFSPTTEPDLHEKYDVDPYLKWGN